MAETAGGALSPQILIGPKKYVQGRGVMAEAGKYVADLGKDAVVIADGEVWGLVGPALERSFKDAQKTSRMR